MPPVNVHKLFCYAPENIKTSLFNFADMKDTSVSQVYNHYLYKYLNEGTTLDLSPILAAQEKKHPKKEPIRFYIPLDAYDQFCSLSKQNLRSIRSQALHFTLFVYSQIHKT